MLRRIIFWKCCNQICKRVLHHHHHPHLVLRVRILLTLSLSLSLSLSLVIRPYRTFLLAGPLADIQYPHNADKYKSLLVGQYQCVHVWESTGERRVWVCPCFSSSAQLVLVRLSSVISEMGSKWSYNCCFAGCCFQDLFKWACSILI